MTTFADLVDTAIEKLPPIRRRLVRLRMRNATYSEMLYNELMVRCCEESSEFATLCEEVEGFGANAPFSLDLDKLDQLLAIIIKYLPSILELILKFV